MKRTKLLLCLASFGLLLTGCGGDDQSTSTSENPYTQDAGLNYSKVAVDTKGLASDYYDVEEDTSVEKPGYKAFTTDRKFDAEKIVGQNYRGMGLLEVRNEQGYQGFYSALHDDYILTPQYVPNTYTYRVRELQDIGFLLEFHYEDQYRIYDAFGNHLRDYENSIYVYNCSTLVVDKVVYLKLAYDYDNSYNEYFYDYFRYSETGVATEVSYIPEATGQQEEVEEYTGPTLNDLFKEGFIDLEGYGLSGYALAQNNGRYITVFKDEQVLSTFYIETANVTAFGIVGTNIYYQLRHSLPTRTESYSYSVGENKYGLETHKIDITTGVDTELEISAVFSSFNPIKDAEGKVDYSLAFYRKINKDKTLSQLFTSVVDKQFVFHNNVSGIGFDGMRRISENRYLDPSGVLYDENLKPITYLNRMGNRRVDIKRQLISGTVDDKYGMVDFDGKVILEFRYSQIYLDYGKESTYIAKKGDEVYRVKTGTTEEEFIGTGLQQLRDDFFKVTNNESEKVIYFTTLKNLFVIDITENIDYSSARMLGEHYVYHIYYQHRDSDDKLVYLDMNCASDEEFTPAFITDAVKGKELTSEMFDGATAETAYKINAGENAIHSIVNSGTPYYAYMRVEGLKEDSYYGFFTEDNAEITRIYEVETNGVAEIYTQINFSLYEDVWKTSNRDYARLYAFRVKEGMSYVARLSTYKQLNNVLVDNVDGLTRNLAVNLGVAGISAAKSYTAPKYVKNVNELWFRCEAPVSGSYSIVSSSSNIFDYMYAYRSGYDYYDNSSYDSLSLNISYTYDIRITLNSSLTSGSSFNVATSASGSSTGSLNYMATLTYAVPFELPTYSYYFSKFTPSDAGYYNFSFSSYGERYVYVVDKAGEVVSKSSSDYNYIPEGGYAVVRTYMQYIGTITVTGENGYSNENPANIASTEPDNFVLNDVAYFKFTVTDIGTFSFFAENGAVKAYYRGEASETYVQFTSSFQYSATAVDPLTIVVKFVAEESTRVWYGFNASDSSSYEYIEMPSYNYTNSVRFYGENIKKVKIDLGTSTSDRDVFFSLDAYDSFKFALSAVGYLDVSSMSSVALTFSYSTVLTVPSSVRYLYLTIYTTALDYYSYISVGVNQARASVERKDWSHELGVYTPEAKVFENGDSFEMYIEGNNQGTISFDFKVGNYGYITIRYQTYSGGVWSDMYDYGSYYSNLGYRHFTYTYTKDVKIYITYTHTSDIEDVDLTAKVTNIEWSQAKIA